MASRAMSAQDALWLTMDRPNNLMVIDGVMVLAEPVTLAATRDVLAALCDRHPVFRRRPVRRRGRWVWDDDPNFDLDRHLTQVALDDDVAALQRLMGERRSDPLPRTQPLWQAIVVTGVHLSNGAVGSAVISRWHHAIADGVRLTQVMLSLTNDADAADAADAMPTAVARSGAGDGTVVESVTSAVHESVRVISRVAALASEAGIAAMGEVASLAAHAVRDPFGAAAALPALPARALGFLASTARSGMDTVELGFDAVRHPDRVVDALEVLGVDDHRALNDLTSVAKLIVSGSDRAVWTGTPGVDKAIAWTEPIPFDLVKRVGRARGATLNDVLVTAVAGAQRRYLTSRGDAADEVIWMVPVNLEPFSTELPEDLGNHFALVMLPLPLHHESSVECLTDVQHRMRRIKHSDEPVLTFGMQTAVSASPDRVAAMLTDFFANKAVGVLTNVPGPRRAITFAGAPVIQTVGFAPCSGDQTMTATIFSYNGSVTVGFATDATLIPDPAELACLVLDELDALASGA